MRLWQLAFGATLFFSLACGDMGGMMGGATGGTEEAEKDKAADEDEEEADEEEEEEEEEEEKEEKDDPVVQKECTAAALGAAAGGSVTAPKCVGRYGAANLGNGKRGLFEFNNGWKLISQGNCTAPMRVCQTLGGF